MLFMPLTLVALSKVEDRDTGLASSLLNTGQQVGGSIGLALLGTVAWTVVANSIHSQVSAAAAAAAKTGHAVPAAGGQLPRAIYDHALALGFSRGFLVSALIALLALVITLVDDPGHAGRTSPVPRRPVPRQPWQRSPPPAAVAAAGCRGGPLTRRPVRGEGPGREAGPLTCPAPSRGVGTAVAHPGGHRGSLRR